MNPENRWAQKAGETTKGVIVLPIMAMNVAKFTAAFLRAILRHLAARYNVMADSSTNLMINQASEKLAA